MVLQSNEQSEVHDEGLRRIGLYNLKDSLFERLYRFHLQEEHCRAVDMLCRQGRMHPGVASFPNREFYAGKLEALGLPHQWRMSMLRFGLSFGAGYGKCFGEDEPE